MKMKKKRGEMKSPSEEKIQLNGVVKKDRAADTNRAHVNHGFTPDPNDEDVVISGISCRLPESDNMAEFEEHLMKGEDMVTEDDRRWEPGLHDLPTRSGKLKDISRFDAAFFGITPKQVNAMDPQMRMLLETAYEALLDAGVQPHSIKGKKVAAIIGCSDSEAMEAYGKDVDAVIGYELTGCSKSMFANRLSFFLGIDGPSYSIDQACSSSLLALEHALKYIRSGQCEAAFVAGCALNLKPGLSKLFHLLGMTADTGACRSFDAKANGFCRGEGLVCIYIQKAKDAKRSYATLVNISDNIDGAKVQGITFPNGEKQQELWESVYKESGVDPLKVTYVEAHSTGTPVGDPQEGNAIDRVFCKDKPRETPLLVGSVKSNMGHAEPAAGIASLAKVVISMEKGVIPPNLHYHSPNPAIPGLCEGRMKVVSEPTEWSGGYMAINSSGFGGTNVHALLKSNMKAQAEVHPAANAQRLVVYCGRTEDGLKIPLEKVHELPENVELHALLQETAHSSLTAHPYRGYTIVNSETEETEIQRCLPSAGQVWFVFPGMGTRWTGMGRELMEIDSFRDSIEESNAILKPVGINLLDLLTKAKDTVFKDVTNTFVCIVSIQVALVDTLKQIGVQPRGMVGHSVGELACGYADGCMTKSQTVLAAYYRGRCIKKAGVTKGGMAAVGMTWGEAKARCPEGVVAACHNAAHSVTVSGAAEPLASFVATLNEEGGFVREVDSNDVPFHSKHLAKAGKSYKAELKKLIKSPQQRSSRWISSSVAKDEWDSSLAKSCSADYHAHNFVSPVLFHEAIQDVPQGAIVVEISPNSIFQNILKKSLPPDCTTLSLMKKESGIRFLLSNIGRLYMAGINVNPLALVRPVSFPVSRGTPMISPLIEWDHSQQWRVPQLEEFYTGGKASGSSYTFELDTSKDGEDRHLVDHVIDGRLVLPVTACLELAWRGLARMHAQDYKQFPVKITNVNIHSPTILPQAGKAKFVVHIMPEDGSFKVSEDDNLLISGYIEELDPNSPRLPMGDDTQTENENEPVMKQADVYKDLRLRGYHYGPKFQGIVQSTCGGEKGLLHWDGLWAPFLDSALQIQGLGLPGRHLLLPKSIKRVHIDPILHETKITTTEDGTRVVDVFFNRQMGTSTAGGVQASGMDTSVANRRTETQAAPVVEQYKFVPLVETTVPASNTLLGYLYECEALLKSRLSALLGNGMQGSIKNASLLKDCILEGDSKKQLPEHQSQSDHYNGNENTLCDFLHELFDMCDMSHGSSEQVYSEGIADLLKTNHLQKDMLLKAIREPRLLKACLDAQIQQSRSFSTMKLCEYQASNGYLFTDVIPQMETHPGIVIEYTALDTNPENLNAASLETHRVQTRCCGLEEEPPSEISDSVLVLASYFSISQSDIVKSLTKITSQMMEGAFILLCEPTKNFPIPLFLSSLKGQFPVISDERTCGPFCDEARWLDIIARSGLQLISKKSDGLMHTLFMCRKDNLQPTLDNCTVIPISTSTYDWVDEVRDAMEKHPEKGDEHRIWLTSEGEPCSGIVGMVNCLREEPNGEAIRCLFRPGAKSGIPQKDFEMLVQRDLSMNAFQDGEWGSFVHFPIDKGSLSTTSAEHARVNIGTKGDVSTLHWIESPFKHPQEDTTTSLCHVAYAAVNRRDVLYATGRLLQDNLSDEQARMDSLLGMEFSGFDEQGRLVMGLTPAKGMATTVQVKSSHLLSVPQTWSLEDAATVTYEYASAYLALSVRCRIEKNQKVLVHLGATPIGQAAMAVALQHGCDLHTSVQSSDEMAFLKERFPQLLDCHFVEVGDSEFQWKILRETGGQAVDVVFGAIAADKLEQSLQILVSKGQLVEMNNIRLTDQIVKAMDMQSISCQSVQLDALLGTNSEELMQVYSLIQRGIQDGTVQPLKSEVFSKDELAEAFRAGQHQNKLLIKIGRSETDDITYSSTVTAQVKTFCDPRKSYVLTGGLGGFGLEIADWLVSRGARCLVLCSRSGVRDGYQALSLRRWRQAGVTVKVLAKDICSMSDTEDLINEATIFGPVGGIFHLAMVLKDGYIDKQTPERFTEVCDPKVKGVHNLDKVSREKCSSSLEWFVTFSSMSCGRGNAGQSNYGFGNSAMERVCEQRKQDGLPGVAIQWGAIGDVGVVFEALGGNEAIIGGSVPQRLSSCLASMDLLLHQPFPVVSIHVLSKRSTASNDGSSKLQVVDTVAFILGINDVSTVDPNLTLGELGLDSLMGLDIRQALEREAGIVLTLAEIRDLTFASLKLRVNGPKVRSRRGRSTIRSIKYGSPTALNTQAEEHYDLERLMPKNSLFKMNESTYHPKQSKRLFLVHPIEGTVKILGTLVSKLESTVYGLQCSDEVSLTSVTDMAAFYLKKMRQVQRKGPYCLAGYSFGACVAFEMATQLEAAGEKVSFLFLLDGAHKFVSEYSKNQQRTGTHFSQTDAESDGICLFIQHFIPLDYAKVKAELKGKADWDGRLHYAATHLMKTGHFSTTSDVLNAINAYCCRVRIGDECTPARNTRIHGRVVAIKASENPHHSSRKVQSETDDLQKYDGPQEELFVPGDHRSFILGSNASRVADIINERMTARSSTRCFCF